MRSINSLPLKNIVKKPASSFALILISAFLALSAFGGTVMVMSLSGGLDSLSARLGADIIVTPYVATSQVSYDSVIIQGKPGQFYMDSKYYEEIKTETELDSALYVDIDTMKELIRAHNEKNPNQEKTIDPDSVVSSVLIKVADGYDIDDVVADINLHAKHLPSQLSGGEQQRVCIARALINHPEIVLADEPTGNLDEANENIVIDIFKQLHRQGTTLIVVTHDPEVAEVAQRTVVLEHGRLVKEIINENFEE